MPPFAIGRTAFDSWILWNACQHASVVDASATVLAIHQNHFTSVTWAEICNSPEAKRNQALAGMWRQSFTLADATHELSPEGVRRKIYDPYINRVNILTGLLRGWTETSLKRMLVWLRLFSFVKSIHTRKSR